MLSSTTGHQFIGFPTFDYAHDPSLSTFDLDFALKSQNGASGASPDLSSAEVFAPDRRLSL